MKTVPALNLTAGDSDLMCAALDDFSPIALEERDNGLRAFFRTHAERDAAHSALSEHFGTEPVDVPDDDWARRSQEGLQPVTVGRITVVPHRQSPIAESATSNQSPISNLQSAIVVIPPSMGFGTGHHATTRLCLEALQRVEVEGKTVCDVGTGSGVLAIAARALGARSAVGIDFDPDAIQSALENLALNPGVTDVSFIVADLDTARLGPADVVTANLTGALLVRSAPTLLNAAAAGGVLILSGLLRDERDDVVRAFGDGWVIWERGDDGWVGLAVKKR